MALQGGHLLRGDDRSVQGPAAKAGGDRPPRPAQSGPEADLRPGWHHQISVGAGRRQLCGVGADALSARQHGVYLLPGGLPDGVCLLRLHRRGEGSGPDPRRND